MTYIVMAYIVMAYTVMAGIVVVKIIVAYAVLANIVLANIVMALDRESCATVPRRMPPGRAHTLFFSGNHPNVIKRCPGTSAPAT